MLLIQRHTGYPFAGLGAQHKPRVDLSMAALNATGNYMSTLPAGAFPAGPPSIALMSTTTLE